MSKVLDWIEEWVGPEPSTQPTHLVPRWLFLRALGLIFFSAFYSYLFQIQGLIGPHGILPAADYLAYLSQNLGPSRFWLAPTLLWMGSGAHAIQSLCWVGLIASLVLTVNIWPRGSLLVCIAVFLSFISASQDFSSYQSDGMLLEAAFISLFLAPAGWRPGLKEGNPPSRASVFLLQWEWFRIYFESGLVKILAGDPHWRHLTAMNDYYQNGPLPTWLGWYAQQCLPVIVHKGTALLTLVVELGVVWMLFLPRRFRLACFVFLLFFQAGIILTANYAFLNYIVVALSIFLLDDGYLDKFRSFLLQCFNSFSRRRWEKVGMRAQLCPHPNPLPRSAREGIGKIISGFFLGWVFYASTARLLLIVSRNLPLPVAPIKALDPFRFANQYGLFAVMTPMRYEIEFQGSIDGKTWIPYAFRYKPQNVDQAPGIYAPYQPRFEWNLWFASLGTWQDYPWVVETQARLLQGSPAVLSLFKNNPFPDKPPIFVRTVLWQYWFSDRESHRQNGIWWRREERGLYAPVLESSPLGKIQMVPGTIPASTVS